MTTPPNLIRVESDGSMWEIDMVLDRYRRFPKRESPRERPEWSDERAGALQDFVWHELTGAPYLRRSLGLWRLVIPIPETRQTVFGLADCVTAPLSLDEAERLRGLGVRSEP